MSLYELFTDGARRLMQLANQEAQRFHHEYIGTEHLLLALVRLDDEGATLLKRLDIDSRKIRLNVEKLIGQGPGRVTIDNPPRTPRAKKVLESAIAEARLLGHEHVGTEHILLGLLREEEGVAAQILINLGLRLEDVRDEMREPSSPRTTAARPEKFADHPLVRSYRAAIEALTQEKEECVANHDFERAAAKRDEADQIKRQLSQLIRRLEADEDPAGPPAGTS